MAYDKQALITYRIHRAKETATEAREAFERNHLQLAENRIYYGMFYMVQALALTQNFTTSRHTQLLGWFNNSCYAAPPCSPCKRGETFNVTLRCSRWASPRLRGD